MRGRTARSRFCSLADLDSEFLDDDRACHHEIRNESALDGAFIAKAPEWMMRLLLALLVR